MRKKENGINLPQRWLHMGTERLKKECFGEIKNRLLFNKPSGGLWASPYENRKDRYLSDWHEKSDEMGFAESEFGVLFSLKENARVCLINHQLHLMEVIRRYPASGLDLFNQQYIDYEKLKEDYDMIYLTEEGQRDTRLPFLNREYNLYGWDCASCIILNFDVIENQETIHVKQYQC